MKLPVSASKGLDFLVQLSPGLHLTETIVLTVHSVRFNGSQLP